MTVTEEDRLRIAEAITAAIRLSPPTEPDPRVLALSEEDKVLHGRAALCRWLVQEHPDLRDDEEMLACIAADPIPEETP